VNQNQTSSPRPYTLVPFPRSTPRNCGPGARAGTHYERETRAALPTTIPVADAVHNISRAAMLVNSFATGNMEALRYACQDVIHQVPGPPCPLTPALPSPPTLPTLPPLTSPAFKPPISKLSRLSRPPHLPPLSLTPLHPAHLPPLSLTPLHPPHHQPIRGEAFPLKELIAAALSKGAHGAFLSGAGPTVLALTAGAHPARPHG
jgi:hypothetical protein